MDQTFEEIYASLTGQALTQYRITGVPDAFQDGSLCCSEYEKVYEARCRLEARLGCQDDRDLATILDGMERIQKVLCFQMYLLGRRNSGP